MSNNGTTQGGFGAPWKWLISGLLILGAVVIYRNEIGQWIPTVSELTVKPGEISIKTTGPIVNLAVSASAYDMAAASSRSAYNTHVQDRDALLETVRDNIRPDFIEQMIQADSQVCRTATKLSRNEDILDFCSDEIQKQLRAFESKFEQVKAKLRIIAESKDKIPSDEVREVSEALRMNENDYYNISYYYLTMGALESLKTYRPESVLPVFLSGLGKIPKSVALNYLIGWTLAHTSAKGGPLASMYFLEEAFSTQSQYKKRLLGTVGTGRVCPVGRYENSEAHIANFIAWLIALEGLRERRDDAERYAHIALTGVASLKQKAKRSAELTKCVAVTDLDLYETAFRDTAGYIKLRFADESKDIEGPEGAIEILMKALDMAHKINQEEYEDIIDQHIKEARTRAKFLHVLEQLEKSIIAK